MKELCYNCGNWDLCEKRKDDVIYRCVDWEEDLRSSEQKEDRE